MAQLARQEAAATEALAEMADMVLWIPKILRLAVQEGLPPARSAETADAADITAGP
jgi:hypothetical protein